MFLNFVLNKKTKQNKKNTTLTTSIIVLYFWMAPFPESVMCLWGPICHSVNVVPNKGAGMDAIPISINQLCWAITRLFPCRLAVASPLADLCLWSQKRPGKMPRSLLRQTPPCTGSVLQPTRQHGNWGHTFPVLKQWGWQPSQPLPPCWQWPWPPWPPILSDPSPFLASCSHPLSSGPAVCMYPWRPMIIHPLWRWKPTSPGTLLRKGAGESPNNIHLLASLFSVQLDRWHFPLNKEWSWIVLALNNSQIV